MWQMYVPCQTDIAQLGHNYENAKMKFEHYAKHNHDDQDILSAAALMVLMGQMDEAKAKLNPYMNEWYCARYGYSLN